MSPPEIWGPPVWTLFHTLAERVSENAYPFIAKNLFLQMVNICKVLPCPDCSNDATKFLANIKISDFKTKTEFKNFIYLFHNYVNAKKRKPLFNHLNIKMYINYPLIQVINNFIAKFNTKGNMKLLSESFQRVLVVKNFKKWIYSNISAFVPPPSSVKIEVQQNNEIDTEQNVELDTEQNNEIDTEEEEKYISDLDEDISDLDEEV